MRNLQDRMWAEALGMLARAERAQRHLYQPGDARERYASWEPPVDVLETADAVLIVAALPGVSRADVAVKLEGASVVIAGRRVSPDEMRTAVIHRLELPHGRFERRVPLPPGEYDQVGLQMSDGCLVVGLRKMP